MKCTPQKTIVDASTRAAIRESASESPVWSATSWISGQLVVVRQQHGVALAGPARGPRRTRRRRPVLGSSVRHGHVVPPAAQSFSPAERKHRERSNGSAVVAPDVTSTSPAGHGRSRRPVARVVGAPTYDRCMSDRAARPTAHEVLAAVLQIRDGTLQVLAWQRAQPPDAGRWALPGGRLGDDEDVEASVRRQLAEKVDVREVAHVEQLAVFSAPGPGAGRPARRHGVPRARPLRRRPGRARRHRAGTRVDALPPTGVRPRRDRRARARDRLRAKLSYTNLGFALAPPRVHDLRAARALRRRAGPPGVGDQPAAGARPARRAGADGRASRRRAAPAGGPRRCSGSPSATLRVTDAFAVLRPPGDREHARAACTVSDVAATLPLFPLGTVLMPGAPLPLHIFEPRYRQLTVDLVTGAVPDKRVRRRRRPRGLDAGRRRQRRPARRRLHGRAARRPPAARRPLRHRHPRLPGASACSTSTPSRARTSWARRVPARRDADASRADDLADARRAPPASAHRRYCATAWKSGDWSEPADDTAAADLPHLLAADCLLPHGGPSAAPGADLARRSGSGWCGPC